MWAKSSRWDRRLAWLVVAGFKIGTWAGATCVARGLSSSNLRGQRADALAESLQVFLWRLLPGETPLVALLPARRMVGATNSVAEKWGTFDNVGNSPPRQNSPPFVVAMPNFAQHYHFTFATLLAMVACFALVAPTRAEEASAARAASTDQLETAQIEAWIGELNSDLYIVRERAMSKLQQAGPVALESLAEAADGTNLEVATRAVRLLLQLSESEDLEVSLAALERIADLKNRPAEQRAAEAILQGRRSREALAAIERLGGVEKGRYEIDGLTIIAHLHLGEQWKGGDDGLRHVRDLDQLQRLTIHGTPVTDKGIEYLKGLKAVARIELYGTKATRAGVDELAKALPHVDIDFRGGAMLGVGGIAHPQGAQVTFIQADSAAWDAGVQPGDVITKFNGQAFQGFEGLTAFIARCEPGEKATLELLRDGQAITKEIRFGKWK